MIRTLDDTSDSMISAGKPAWQLGPRGRAQPRRSPRRCEPLLTHGVKALPPVASMRQLRSSGVPHDRAVREALGLGLISSEAPRQAAPALYFAGQA